MEEETKEKRIYQVNIGDTITIVRQDVDWKGKKLVFYKCPITIGTNPETAQTFHKTLMFNKGTSIENGTKIKIKDMFEFCRHKDKFNDTFGLFILDYEVVSGNVKKAVEEYKEAVSKNDDMIF